MPKSAEHREKAERNQKFLDALKDNDDVREWKAVVAFYTALHLVERLSLSIRFITTIIKIVSHFFAGRATSTVTFTLRSQLYMTQHIQRTTER